MYEAGIFYEAFFYGLMDDGHDPLCDNAGVDRPDPDGYGGGSPAEEFLTGVVAAEIPAEYGIETIKSTGGACEDIYLPACGSGAGTYPGRGTGHRLSQHEGRWKKKWGKDNFREYYGKIRTAVQETEGLVAEYDGELIEPFYCEASAGKTRELAAYPYICSVESPGDLEAGEFLCVRTFTEAEFADKIGRIGGPRPERTALRKNSDHRAG